MRNAKLRQFWLYLQFLDSSPETSFARNSATVKKGQFVHSIGVIGSIVRKSKTKNQIFIRQYNHSPAKIIFTSLMLKDQMLNIVICLN